MKHSLLFALILLVSCQPTSDDVEKVRATIATGSVDGDADDCAIWIDHTDPSRSIVIGNDKTSDGALYIWEMLTGKEIFRTGILNAPVNPDVRQGVEFGDHTLDLLGCGLRGPSTIEIYSIDPQTRTLKNITSTDGIASGYLDDLYGFTFYQRPQDGALFCFVSRAEKGANIHQIRLELDDDGTISGKIVRRFGANDIVSVVEGMVCDDELGYLYAADEDGAILKYHADPAAQDDALVARFATGDGIRGDREGLAIYFKPNKEGYLVLSSQGNSTVKVYGRRSPNPFIKTLLTEGSLHTDGLDCTSTPIPPLFPEGLLICHNEADANFVLYSWKDLNL
jgi:3-phytase